MLIGLNNKLEDAIRRFNDFLKTDEGSSFEEFKNKHYDLAEHIAMAVAAGEKWEVPTDRLEYDEVTETVKAVIRGLQTQDGGAHLVAFTSKAAADNAEDWTDGGTELIPAETILEQMLRNEQITALRLNPGERNSSYVLTRQGAEVIQKWSENFRFSDMLPLMEYKMEPLAVIDTRRIFERYWGNDREEGGLNWELDSYPILPDGSVMLNYTAKKEDGSEICRSVCLQQADNCFAVGTFEVDLHGARLGTAAVFNGELWGVITDEENGGYVAQKVNPWDETTRYGLYSNIHTMVWKPEGTPVVAYRSNMRDPQKAPLGIFDREGKGQWYRFELALECRDVNLDRENNVWAYLFPSNCLTEINEKGEAKSVPVALQGFKAFAMSSDKRHLVTFFSRYGDECLIFVQHLTEDGYSNPILFNFEPFDEEGNPIDITDCREYGQVSVMKDRFMILVDGRLFCFSADKLPD